MKKLIATIFTLFICAGVFAQTAIPRTGNTPNVDNTYRTLNYAFVSPVQDKTGLDTIIVAPYAFHTQVYVDSILDSVAISIPVVTNSYLGDELEIQFLNTANGKCIRWDTRNIVVNTVGTIGSQNGVLYLTASKRGNILFKFDGTKWVEYSRFVQL
jgi:hypothetical protein